MRNLARFVRNVGSRNRDRRLFALKMIADRLIPDYRLTWHQMDWWHDEDFNAYLERFDERGRFNTHRKWTLWQLLRLVAGVEGDTAECGVYEGASSWLICAANRGTRRIHHLFDSFEGLSAPSAADGAHWKAGDLAAGEQVVREKLGPFLDRLAFHRGWIPTAFPKVEDRTFAFVHVDVDLRQPTLESLSFFYPRLATGGILLCDDYACTTCPGATEAIDGFLADKPEKMIALPAGGGFFIKGVEASPRQSTLA